MLRKQKERIYKLFERLTFSRIFLMWISIIVLFGFLYYLAKSDKSYLQYTKLGKPVDLLTDCIYFSFITATSTGFGDIVPVGIEKLVALVEVIVGLSLLAIVTSRLVSLKQEVILNEIYNISLNEKINRLRSAFHLFRSDIDRLIAKVEEDTIKKREMNELWTNLSFFEYRIDEVLSMFCCKTGREKIFVKDLDLINTEIIVNGINLSIDKIIELLTLNEEKNIEWKSELSVKILKRILEKTEGLYNALLDSENFRNAKEILDLRADFLNKRNVLLKKMD